MDEDLIGVNEQGIVKVWMNPEFMRSSPAGNRISEYAMVAGLIDIIENSADKLKMPPNDPSIKNFLFA